MTAARRWAVPPIESPPWQQGRRDFLDFAIELMEDGQNELAVVAAQTHLALVRAAESGKPFDHGAFQADVLNELLDAPGAAKGRGKPTAREQTIELIQDVAQATGALHV